MGRQKKKNKKQKRKKKGKKKKRISNCQWVRILRDASDDGYCLWKRAVSSTIANHTVRRQVRLWWGVLRITLGSSACLIESLDRALRVYPISHAGRKFQGKYIFYAEQSKLILSLSQLFAPVSIKCLRRAQLLRNLSSKGHRGGQG